MISATLLFLYYFWLFTRYGFAFAVILNRVLRKDLILNLPISIVAMLGMVVTSVLASTVNLFLYLGFPFTLLMSVGAIVLHVKMRSFRTLRIPPLPFWFWLTVGLVFLMVLEISTHRPSVSDTALYHAQTIRWFETYPVIPGLGNLHHRLAFNSSWLVLNAALSFSSFDFQSFHLVSGFFFLVAQLFFLGGLSELFQGKLPWAALFKILAIPLSFYLLSSVVSSPAYDMPVAILTWLIVILWLEAMEDGSKSDAYLPAIFILAVYAVTIKLSALPLLLFPSWILFRYTKPGNWRNFATFGALAAIILVPWMTRSVILSGYLIFPVSQPDLFSFDWKIPAGQVEEVRNGIVGFARQPGKDWAEVLSMPFSLWFPLWFENLTLNQRGIFVLAALSPIVLGLARLSNPSLIHSRQLFGYFVLFSGAVFWFLFAPDVRFGYGYLAGIFLFLASLGLLNLLQRVDPPLKLSKQIASSALIVFQLYSLSFSFDASTWTSRIVLPIDYARSRAESCDIKNITIFCRVEGGQCNYEKFPCIPSPRPNIELRGPSYQDGFRDIGND